MPAATATVLGALAIRRQRERRASRRRSARERRRHIAGNAARAAIFTLPGQPFAERRNQFPRLFLGQLLENLFNFAHRAFGGERFGIACTATAV
jgi:hypothetical protein